MFCIISSVLLHSWLISDTLCTFTTVLKTYKHQCNYFFLVTLELSCHKCISGPLHWYYIVFSTSKTIFSLDFLPLSKHVLYHCVHTYPYWIIPKCIWGTACIYISHRFVIIYHTSQIFVQKVILNQGYICTFFSFKNLDYCCSDFDYSLYTKCQTWNYSINISISS